MVSFDLADGLVDSAAVVAITRQFKHLTRRGKFSDDNRRLTPRLVYEEIRARANDGKELSEGASVADLRDHSFRWKSFDDWKDTSWEARVALAFEEKQRQREAGLDDGANDVASTTPHLNNIVGSLLALPSLAKVLLSDTWVPFGASDGAAVPTHQVVGESHGQTTMV